MVYLTRREHFNAAHRLNCEHWTAEKNEEVFGKCANRNWHGHNYEIYVTVAGEPNPDTGFVINAKELSKIIQEVIVNKLDHRNLNLDVDFIPNGMQPSTENVVICIWNELKPHIKGCKLHCIKLQETDNIYAEYFG
ncbi:MAG: 6-carboxytetrahydropterin synthase [Bacteroidetes bacterium]|nr:6-carboxytetrahydropterin synthase [Bacteroidota bacterium]MBP7476969.1 6-carboxytetrahydropterin synthase [Chitinophagales bacterium]